jgi:hypothetical protein
MKWDDEPETLSWNEEIHGDGNVKFDLLAQQKSDYNEILRSYQEAFKTDSVITMRDYTPVEIEQNRTNFRNQTRVVHGGEREKIVSTIDKIAARTCGKIIYCEQVVQILNEVGGFALTDCEKIRKCIAKKQAVKVDAYRLMFWANASKGLQNNEILDLWDKLENAGTYNFLESHQIARLHAYKSAHNRGLEEWCLSSPKNNEK